MNQTSLSAGGGNEMTKLKPFNALAYAIDVLGQPHKTGKDRSIEVSHGLVAVVHMWRLPCGRFLEVEEWDDGDQGVVGTVGLVGLVARDNDDGSLFPMYEEQARALIDAYAEAVR